MRIKNQLFKKYLKEDNFWIERWMFYGHVQKYYIRKIMKFQKLI